MALIFPDRLLINDFEYDIFFKESVTSDSGERLFGLTVPNAIYILDSLTERQKWIVLCHEVLHILTYGHPVAEDEFFIDSVARGLWRFIAQLEGEWDG